MDANYRFEIAADSDDTELLSFIKKSYPHWGSEFFNWQYKDNPAGRAQNFVAKCGDEIVANTTIIPHKLIFQGEKVTSWRVQDVLTSEKHRGKGLFSSVLAAANEYAQRPEFPVNFTFPNESSHRHFVKGLWEAKNRIPLWKKQGPFLETDLKSVEVAEIKTFSDEHIDIYNEFSSESPIGVFRDKAFFNWRYTKHPLNQYYPMEIKGPDFHGLIVLKLYVEAPGVHKAHLIDWAFQGDAGSFFNSACHKLENFAASKNCNEISMWSQPSSQLSAVLRQKGYELDLQITRWHVLNANGLDSKTEKFAFDFDNWNIAMGDSDVY